MQTVSRVFLLMLACVVLPVQAQPRETVEGVHYQALATAVPTETDADHIEVREIFWYGCPECYSFDPIMTDWRDGTTGDLVFVRMPAVWNDLMALHARIYYTGKALKQEDRINEAAFAAVHEDGKPLRSESEIREFFLANGIKAADFDSAWNSAEVLDAVKQARSLTAAYGVDRLPAVIVNGRYRLVENARVFNHVELNIAINNVVRKQREERRSDF